jgi:predicted small integral membrane protein
MSGMIRSVEFLLHHTLHAGAAAVLFAAGMACATPVYQRRMERLLSFPRWVARVLRQLRERKPSVPALGLFIFAFNGVAMLVYMLLGTVPGLAALISFFTGLNVILIGLLAREIPSDDAAPRRAPPISVRLCGLLTLLLELPCFWYTMGMTFWMTPGLFAMWRSADWSPLAERVTAYLTVILPILFVSAMAEAYAVSFSYRDGD